MKYYLAVLKKYGDFNGRARRKEYWMFFLFNSIFALVASILDLFLGFKISDYGLIYGIYMLILIVPSLAVGVRRLHDINKSGVWILIGLIPIIGTIWLLILLCTDGINIGNQYGPDPKILETEFKDI